MWSKAKNIDLNRAYFCSLISLVFKLQTGRNWRVFLIVEFSHFMALWIWNSSNHLKFPALWREQQCSPAVGADQREETGNVAMAIPQTAVGERNAAVHFGASLSSVATRAWFFAHEILRNFSGFSELPDVGGRRQHISAGPPWTQLGRLPGLFSGCWWSQSDAEELKAAKSPWAQWAAQLAREGPQGDEWQLPLDQGDHLESDWKGFRLNCSSLLLNWSNPSCPMGCMKGTPGSLHDLDLSGMIPVLLNRTSCLCVNSVLWVLQLVGLWNLYE